MNEKNQLLEQLDKLHTTDLGVLRIRRNLSLDTNDVVAWCREKIQSPESQVERKGKNWYVTIAGCILTVNAASLTLITAHRQR